MREAVQRLQEMLPDIEIEGEMKADAAISDAIRDKLMPDSNLKGSANLLIMPNLDAANISANLVRQMEQGFYVGPILMGAAKSAHIVSRHRSAERRVGQECVSTVRSRWGPG